VHVVRWRLAPHWRLVGQEARGITVAHPEGGAARLSVECDGLIGFEVGEDFVSPHFGDVQRGMVATVIFQRRLVSQWQRARAERHP